MKQYRVSFILNDVVGDKMAGPAIRYWELARVLSQHVSVSLIVPPFVASKSTPPSHPAPADLHICHQEADLRQLVAASDIVVTLGTVLLLYPFIVQTAPYLVLDLYMPFLLELLQREQDFSPLQAQQNYDNYLQALRQQLQQGDFFICAGEKQRDYYLGMLSACGRTNFHTHRADPTLRKLIDTVPFGLPADLPPPGQPVLKGVYKTIRPGDKVLLWTGGIWPWLDAPTVIEAVALLAQERDDVKLFFMGTKRPNQSQTMAPAVQRAIDLSKKLDVCDSFVFFNDWVPYETRHHYLLEADVGLSLHLEHVETRFAFRTRLLDHIWASLPTVATQGDVLGEFLAEHHVAALVPPGDASAVAHTLQIWLDKPNLAQTLAPHFRTLQTQFQWERVAQPLLNFCLHPYSAPDKVYLTALSAPSVWHKASRAWRQGGPVSVARQVWQYVRWKLHRR